MCLLIYLFKEFSRIVKQKIILFESKQVKIYTPFLWRTSGENFEFPAITKLGMTLEYSLG